MQIELAAYPIRCHRPRSINQMQNQILWNGVRKRTTCILDTSLKAQILRMKIKRFCRIVDDTRCHLFTCLSCVQRRKENTRIASIQKSTVRKKHENSEEHSVTPTLPMDDKEETRKTDSLTVIPTFMQCSYQPSSSATIEIQLLHSVETKGKDVREFLDKIEWVMIK